MIFKKKEKLMRKPNANELKITEIKCFEKMNTKKIRNSILSAMTKKTQSLNTKENRKKY